MCYTITCRRRMKRKFLYLALFLIIPSIVYCRIASKIGGQIRSAENEAPISYVRIEIIKTGETILTDEEGRFVVESDPYKESTELSISSIGYKKKNYVFEQGVRYAVILLEPEPIIIPGITVKDKKKNVLTLSQSNISVILPNHANELETSRLIARHPDIILEENAVGEKTIRIIGHEARHVAIMIDGVKVNNPAVNSIQSIPFEQIDHIEVLTGNASSNAGDAAMGGAINFVTKKPLKDFSQDVFLTTGSWDDYSANLQINLAIGSISNLVNIYGHTGKQDFIYYNAQEDKNIKRSNNDITEGSISTKSTFHFSDHTSSDLSFQWYKAERGIPGQTTDYMWFENARAHASRIAVKEVVVVDAGENRHEFSVSYQHAKSHYINNIENPFYAYDSENRSDIFDVTWQFEHLIGSCSSRLKAGFRNETYAYNDDLDPAQSISLKTRSNVFTSYESSIPVTIFKRDISFIPSIRVDKLVEDDAFLSSHLTIEIPRDPDNFQLSFSGGNSYTMPAFTSLFWKGDSRVQGNPDLEPEQSIGGKTSISWESRSFSMKFSGSYNRIDNLIYWYRSAMGVWMPENLADAELYGFSGHLRWSPFKLFELSVSGSKIYPFNKTSSGDHFDKYLPHRPLQKIRSEITFILNPVELNFSTTNLGKQYDNFSNTVVVDGYTTCDAGISYHADISDKCKIQAYVGARNILNASYETSRNIPAPGRSFECSCKLILK